MEVLYFFQNFGEMGPSDDRSEQDVSPEILLIV